MIYIGLLLVGLGIFIAPHGLGLPEGLVLRLIIPPASAATEAARESRSLIDIIRSIRTLHQENATLKADNLRLQAELDSLRDVQHENSVLRNELGFAADERDRFELTPAQVVGRSPSTFLQFIIIDQGSADGVSVGQGVVSQGFLIGRVTEVAAQSAHVELVTASRSLIPIVLSQSRSTGLLKGGLAGLTGEELSADIEIVPGEGVLTSPLGEIVPGDLPVGTVTMKLSTDSDIIQRVQISSPIEFSKLETVIVLRPRTN